MALRAACAARAAQHPPSPTRRQPLEAVRRSGRRGLHPPKRRPRPAGPRCDGAVVRGAQHRVGGQLDRGQRRYPARVPAQHRHASAGVSTSGAVSPDCAKTQVPDAKRRVGGAAHDAAEADRQCVDPPLVATPQRGEGAVREVRPQRPDTQRAVGIGGYQVVTLHRQCADTHDWASWARVKRGTAAARGSVPHAHHAVLAAADEPALPAGQRVNRSGVSFEGAVLR